MLVPPTAAKYPQTFYRFFKAFYSSMIVGYNFVIGVLLMLASDKLAASAGYLTKTHRETIVRRHQRVLA